MKFTFIQMMRSKIFCVIYLIQISLLTKVFQVDIAISTIDSAIDFDDTFEFTSLVSTYTIKWSGLSLIDGFL